MTSKIPPAAWSLGDDAGRHRGIRKLCHPRTNKRRSQACEGERRSIGAAGQTLRIKGKRQSSGVMLAKHY